MEHDKSVTEKERGKVGACAKSELIDVVEVARMCGMSQSMYKKLYCMEMTPEGIKLGRLRRWRRAEILAWIEAGCPCRSKWTVVRKDFYKPK